MVGHPWRLKRPRTEVVLGWLAIVDPRKGWPWGLRSSRDKVPDGRAAARVQKRRAEITLRVITVEQVYSSWSLDVALCKHSRDASFPVHSHRAFL